MRIWKWVYGTLIALLICGPAVLAADEAQPKSDPTKPGDLRVHATLQCIGIEWDITGDSNHNAVCPVHYRVKGTEDWKEALPLFRIDFHGWYGQKMPDRGYNMFAGSVLFLEPGTSYEVKRV